MQDLRSFLLFIRNYLLQKALGFGHGVEKVKDLIVALLVVKRGKYSNSFLNTSFLLLVAAGFIGGPVIAENNPFLNSLGQGSDNYQASEISYNPYNNSLGTVISNKPPSTIRDYKVANGDTIGSIAQKFSVSINTIKWANNMKSDVIKPGQSLKIPPITGVVHKVALGDNIYSVAKKYKVDPQNILNFPFNDFEDLSTFSLAPGQILYVPDGVIEDERAPVRTAPTTAQVIAGVKGSSNFIWPTNGTITQYPIWYHMALDIANNASPPVIASDTGTVTQAFCEAYDYGCHVVVDHGNGYQTLYGHLSFIGVSAGQAVDQGQKIGTMGSTGRSTGIHLHFEIRSGGQLLNPLNFLK
ncbi:MAG: M23 family metallopeptidase [Patescibacteria group bacterium]